MFLRFSLSSKRADYLNTLAIAHSVIYLILTVVTLIICSAVIFFNRYLMWTAFSYEV